MRVSKPDNMEELVEDCEPDEKRTDWVIGSRKNTTEEKTRQRKEWRKRKQERKIANSTNTDGSQQLPSLNWETNAMYF